MLLQQCEQLSQARDLVAFRGALVGMAEHLGFGLVTATLVTEGFGPRSAARFASVGNTPAGFEEAFANVDSSRRDPVMRRYKELTVPFTYDWRTYAEDDAGDLWEEQAPFGYRTGVCVGLHLPGHQHFLLGVDRDERLPADEIRLTRMMADLQFVAMHAQAAARRLLGRSDGNPAVHLTQRELEVLHWTREGKSASVVAELLGVSSHAVDFHLRNASRKLGTSSKAQAVLKAIALGLLMPPSVN